ncbi:MAG: c-type cytochrome [Deltaproteobacteria bacterium]|nr:c-type cytochrome [Deltaproteobacteria bacterium]MBW2396247.1 c-type cytochrome [Deltaproteobacteria bacterium]
MQTLGSDAPFEETATEDPAPEIAPEPPEPEPASGDGLELVGDPAAGATKALGCGGCHGPGGNSVVPLFPKLAGQKADYITKQLRDFQAKRRLDPMMAGMAAPLSEQDIEDLGAHFEQQQVTGAIVDAKIASRGELLYREGRPERGLPPCASCHGPQGEGFHGVGDASFPALGSQNAAYLAKQLKQFRAGERGNDWNQVMREVADVLSDADIQDLASYLSGLARPGVQPSP